MKNPDKGVNHWRMINPLGGSPFATQMVLGLPTVNPIFPPAGKYGKTEFFIRRKKFRFFTKAKNRKVHKPPNSYYIIPQRNLIVSF